MSGFDGTVPVVSGPPAEAPRAHRPAPVAPVRPAPSSALAALHGVPEPPLHYLPRPGPLAALRTALLEGDGPRLGVSAALGTGLFGLGGIGKTVLAAAVARDEEVRRAFAGGIYWVTLGQQPSLVSLQQALLEAVTGQRVALESVTTGSRRLRDAMQTGNSLLVLDDAWELEHVRLMRARRILFRPREEVRRLVRLIGDVPMAFGTRRPPRLLRH